ncbi:MAG: prepilin peptidase [Gemmatimonadaceae bacterium]|nr:prepilin peptidase [Gemmatimonadaceae bacterium]
MTETTAFAALAGVVGAAIGSFLNVCVSRWPAGLSVVAPRSRCPRCGRPITWYENIPVVSWIALRAKCAGCGLPISVQYPAVELLVAALWAGAVVVSGPGFTALRLAVFATLLLGIVLTDAQFFEIPDGFTVTGLVAGLGGALASALMGDVGAPFAPLPDALVGACAGAGLIAIAGWLGEVVLKREAMGFGDVTLMAMVGAHVGSWRSLLVVFAGALLGTVGIVAMRLVRPTALAPSAAAERGTATEVEADAAAAEPGLPAEGSLPEQALPFGVFLAPAALVVLWWGDAAIAWYLRISGLEPPMPF